MGRPRKDSFPIVLPAKYVFNLFDFLPDRWKRYHISNFLVVKYPELTSSGSEIPLLGIYIEEIMKDGGQDVHCFIFCNLKRQKHPKNTWADYSTLMRLKSLQPLKSHCKPGVLNLSLLHFVEISGGMFTFFTYFCLAWNILQISMHLFTFAFEFLNYLINKCIRNME